MSDALAAIALFAFNRPHHLRRSVEALLANDLASKSKLYIFCDGARHALDHEAVNEVRTYVRDLEGFGSKELVFRHDNLGLAKSIISGVTAVLAEHPSVIVLEDDLVTSPYFLRYMNTALGLYRNDDRVASIHGYVYPIEGAVPETFFLRGADCWGWATWPRAWAKFNPNSHALLEQLTQRGLTQRFDMDGSFGFSQMLEEHAAGKNDSWAVRWHASTFLENMLTLYPGRSLVENIGLDSSGTHCRSSQAFGGSVRFSRVEVTKTAIEEHEGARQAFIAYFRSSEDLAKARVTLPAQSAPAPLHGVGGWIRRRWARWALPGRHFTSHDA